MKVEYDFSGRDKNGKVLHGNGCCFAVENGELKHYLLIGDDFVEVEWLNGNFKQTTTSEEIIDLR